MLDVEVLNWSTPSMTNNLPLWHLVTKHFTIFLKNLYHSISTSMNMSLYFIILDYYTKFSKFHNVAKILNSLSDLIASKLYICTLYLYTPPKFISLSTFLFHLLYVHLHILIQKKMSCISPFLTLNVIG